ncbi:MAG: Do family serine endopeptidase [Acidobacteria bacterium]|nr:Do family serine endopeptidase [Acidobacteriota bacterium]MCW5949362.1 Do family serine endopeptidase [Pyrinomonadaceae bacterium]
MFDARKLTLLVGFSLLFTASCKPGLFGAKAEPDAAPVQPPQPLVIDGVRASYADVVEKTTPAVVRIRAERKETEGPGMMQSPFGDDLFRQFGFPPQQQPRQQPRIERGAGSGVIVKSDGTILTNNHVVEGAQKITVITNDNRSFDAKIVGTDKPSDLAVIKVEATDLPFLTLGNSDSVRVGDIVLAIGNPLDIGQSVTAGIISAKSRRTGLSDGSYEDFLQTDAPINRGNSGGALVNLGGELIGINSQILSPGGASGGNIGIGFAIPSNMARTVMEQLIANGRVRRGQLGINIQNIDADTAEALKLKDSVGVLVSNVKPGSAADKAGLKREDVIIAVNGEKVEDSNALRNKVAQTPPGTAIKLTVIRNGSETELSATLDESDADKAAAGAKNDEKSEGSGDQGGKLGVSLQPVTPQIAKQLGLDSTDGLVISDIDPAGPAAEAGLTRGDVLLEVNRKPVKTTDDVRSALADAGGKPVALLVSRRGQVTYVVVRPK